MAFSFMQETLSDSNVLFEFELLLFFCHHSLKTDFLQNGDDLSYTKPPISWQPFLANLVSMVFAKSHSHSTKTMQV